MATSMLLVVETSAVKLRRLELQMAETTHPVQADALVVDTLVHPGQLDVTVGVDVEFDHGAVFGVSGIQEGFLKGSYPLFLPPNKQDEIEARTKRVNTSRCLSESQGMNG